MKDWIAIARAAGLNIPPEDIARAAGALNALEDAFRPLTRDLPPDLEPAAAFRADEEEE